MSLLCVSIHQVSPTGGHAAIDCIAVVIIRESIAQLLNWIKFCRSLIRVCQFQIDSELIFWNRLIIMIETDKHQVSGEFDRFVACRFKIICSTHTSRPCI